MHLKFRMNIQHLEARIESLKQGRDKCQCDGPGCTMLRQDMTRLIGIYEKLRLDMLEAIQLSREIAQRLKKPSDPKCK